MNEEQERYLKSDPNVTSHEERLRLEELQVDEALWGPGAEPIVKRWLAENYDETTMPKLQAATIQGKGEGKWLLGWASQGEEPGLLAVIFGNDYQEQQLARISMRKALSKLDNRIDGGHRRG